MFDNLKNSVIGAGIKSIVCNIFNVLTDINSFKLRTVCEHKRIDKLNTVIEVDSCKLGAIYKCTLIDFVGITADIE